MSSFLARHNTNYNGSECCPQWNSRNMSKKGMSINILRKVVVDVVLLCALGVCVYVANFIWHPFLRGFFCGDESLMYPYKDNTVTTPMLRLSQCVPVLIFFICEWILLRHDIEDQHCLGVRIPKWVRGFYCAAVSYALGILFVELCAIIAKNTIGRPRPHFFDLCKPSVNCSSAEWRGRYIQSNEYHCTGDASASKLADAQLSFLSGHSAASAFSMIYLALYLEKRMRWRGTRVLRHSLQFLALMVSWFTALSRVSDYKHHWSDVLAGYFMGAAFAVLMWRWGTDLVQKDKTDYTLPHHDEIQVRNIS